MRTKLLDIGVVFFDAAGTLFHVRGSVGAIYSQVAARYGIQSSPDQIEQCFINAFRKKSAEGIAPEDVIEPEAAEKAWWLDVVCEVFAGRMSDLVMQAYFEDVFEYFRSAAAWEVYTETVGTLKDLRSRGLRLAIISNFDSRLFDILENLRIGEFFENTFISWRSGVSKPDPRIFRQATNQMKVAPARSLHVGDSFQEDYKGAIDAGLHAVWLNRRGQDPPIGEIRTIRNLAELKGFVS